MSPIHSLEYHTETRQTKSLILPIVLLVFVSGLLWTLHEMAIEPYRPPDDMSTALDGQEEAIVSFLMAVLGVVWVGLLVWGFVRFRRNRAFQS